MMMVIGDLKGYSDAIEFKTSRVDSTEDAGNDI